jgi:uncharacterized membrane protein YjfL (UPF0719 family)
MPTLIANVLLALLWAFIGVFVFAVSFVVVDKLTPYDLWRELCETRNTALGLVVGMSALGICIIIAAAIHG